MSAEEVAKLLNISLAKVFQLRAKGLLLAVRVRTFPRNPNFTKDVYPRWQFDEKKGKQIKGFKDVLKMLKDNVNVDDDDWRKLMFFLSKAGSLKKTPLEELREGNIRGVVLSAQGYGEQGGR